MVECTRSCGLGCAATAGLSLVGGAAIAVGAKAYQLSQSKGDLAIELGKCLGWDPWPIVDCYQLTSNLETVCQQELSYSIAALALGVLTVAGVAITGGVASYCMSRWNVARY